MLKLPYNHNAKEFTHACLGDEGDRYNTFIVTLSCIFVETFNNTTNTSEVVEAIEEFVTQDPRVIRMAIMMLVSVMPATISNMDDNIQKHIITTALGDTEEEYEKAKALAEQEALEELKASTKGQEDIISDLKKMVKEVTDKIVSKEDDTKGK